MSRLNTIKKYLPHYYGNSQVFLALMGSEAIELDRLGTSIGDMLNQFYVATATETGLARWESFLNLSSETGKPPDERRSRIISKLRGLGTVSLALIQNVAESFVYGTVAVTEHPETYSFLIKFVDTRGLPANLADIQAAIEEIKPAHLGVSYEFTYMTWDEFDAFNRSWDQWDALNLMWNEFEVYREVI